MGAEEAIPAALRVLILILAFAVGSLCAVTLLTPAADTRDDLTMEIKDVGRGERGPLGRTLGDAVGGLGRCMVVERMDRFGLVESM